MKQPLSGKIDKLIFLILLLFPFWSNAQSIKEYNPWLQYDKLMHFSLSAGFTPAPIMILQDWNVKHPEIKGIALIFGAGLVKEFVLDSKPQYEDVLVNAAGCLAGYFLNKWINKIYEKHHAKGKENETLINHTSKKKEKAIP